MRVNIKYNVKRVFALILHFFRYTLKGISLEIRRVFIQPHLYYNFFRLEYLNVIWREPYDDEDDTEVGRNERWRWWRGERLNQKYTQADSWTFITVSKTFFINILLEMFCQECMSLGVRVCCFRLVKPDTRILKSFLFQMVLYGVRGAQLKLFHWIDYAVIFFVIVFALHYTYI